METAEKQTKSPATEAKAITLDTPMRDGKVQDVSIRKPLGGALRGVALVDLMNMDTRSLEKILPRITEPSLSEAECRNLDPADLVQMGTAVATFLLGKRAETEA